MFLRLCLCLCYPKFSAHVAENAFSTSEKACTCCEFQPIREQYLFSLNICIVFGTPCVNPHCTFQNVFQEKDVIEPLEYDIMDLAEPSSSKSGKEHYLENI